MRLLANVLALEKDLGKEAHSVGAWRQVIRLGQAVIASGRVFPELTIDGTDIGRAPVRRRGGTGPPARRSRDATGELRHDRGHETAPTMGPQVAIHAGLDAVAEAMLRGPGTPTVLGRGPFTGAVARQQHAPALVQWNDALRDGTNHHIDRPPDPVQPLLSPAPGPPAVRPSGTGRASSPCYFSCRLTVQETAPSASGWSELSRSLPST